MGSRRPFSLTLPGAAHALHVGDTLPLRPVPGRFLCAHSMGVVQQYCSPSLSCVLGYTIVVSLNVLFVAMFIVGVVLLGIGGSEEPESHIKDPFMRIPLCPFAPGLWVVPSNAEIAANGGGCSNSTLPGQTYRVQFPVLRVLNPRYEYRLLFHRSLAEASTSAVADSFLMVVSTLVDDTVFTLPSTGTRWTLPSSNVNSNPPYGTTRTSGPRAGQRATLFDQESSI